MQTNEFQATVPNPPIDRRHAHPFQWLAHWGDPLVLGAFLGSLVALFLFVWGVQGVDIRAMNDLGLVSVLSPLVVVALVLLMASFCVALRTLNTPLLLWLLVLLVCMLYGLTSLTEPNVHFSTIYRHQGYTEYIARTGTVDTGLDAYFSWPGFFALLATIIRVAGLPDIYGMALVAPVAYNLLYLLPMAAILAQATPNRRLVWLSLWFFALTNWIGQDYISPQGLGLFFYLVIVAVLLRWFQPHPADPLRPGQRVAVLGGLIVLDVAITASHQLTPFFLVATVGVLTLLRRVTPIWLAPLFGAILAFWLVVVAHPFLAGHTADVFGQAGQVLSNLSENIGSRSVTSSPQHAIITQMRTGMTIVFWTLALVGMVLRFRAGFRDVALLAVALTPFPFILLQSYGGEMMLRIYFFTLPAMAFFVASLFFSPAHITFPTWKMAVVGVTCVALLWVFGYTRYGNERMYYVTDQEKAAINHLYAMAPLRSMLISGWDGIPWRDRAFEQFEYINLKDQEPQAFTTGDVAKLIGFIRYEKRPAAFVIITRTERATADATSGLASGMLQTYEQQLLRSQQFTLVYHNQDGDILRYVGVPTGPPHQPATGTPKESHP